MPLILAPYTLGAELGVASPVATGGAYAFRKRRYLAYMAAVLAFLIVVPI